MAGMQSPTSGTGGDGFASSPMSDDYGSRNPGEPHVDEVSSADQEYLDAMHSQQSEAPSHMIQQKVVNETKIYNTVNYVYRVNKDWMRNIKNKTDEFMALGRTEFHKNLTAW